MVDRIRWDTVSYLLFYYIFFEINFQFLLLTIFNLQTKILAIKDILSNLGGGGATRIVPKYTKASKINGTPQRCLLEKLQFTVALCNEI